MTQYVVSILKNHFQGTWHPVVLGISPLPRISGTLGKVNRYRVSGYSPEGFPNREAAIAFAKSRWMSTLDDAVGAFERDIDWGGRDAPEFTYLYSSSRGLIAFE